MLSRVIGAIKDALAAIAGGKSGSTSAAGSAEFRATLGYGDYEREAKRSTTSG